MEHISVVTVDWTLSSATHSYKHCVDNIVHTSLCWGLSVADSAGSIWKHEAGTITIPGPDFDCQYIMLVVTASMLVVSTSGWCR